MGDRMNIPPPPAGFELINDDVPPPPPGFELISAEPSRVETVSDSQPVPDTPAMDASAMGWLDYSNGLAQKIAQGVTFNWGDEAAASAGSLFGLGPRLFGTKTYDDIIKDVRSDEESFTKAFPKTALAAEIGGALATAVPSGAGVAARLPGFFQNGLMRQAIGAGAAAAPLGALNEVGKLENPQTPGEIGNAALSGAGTAAGFAAPLSIAGGTVARVAGPWVRDAARALHDRGIRLTPGEMLGGYADRAEQALGSAPFLGHLIRGRKTEGVEDLNRAAFDEALQPMAATAPVTGRVPHGTPVGHDMTQAATDVFNHRYGVVVPRLRAVADSPFQAEVARISGTLPQTVRPQFADAFRRHVDENLDNGVLTGRAIQDSLQGLRKEASRLRKTPGNAYDVDLADGLTAMRAAVEASAGRHSSQRTVTAFNAINRAYRNFVTLRDAGSSVAAEGGVWTPAMLHAAVKRADQSVGKGAFARGTAPMQELSDAAKTIMSRKVADSGTPERAALMGAFMAPSTTASAAVAGIPLALLYTRAGNALFRRLAAGSPVTRTALRRAIEEATRGAAGAGEVMSNAYNDQ